jgi:hypothetical protein
MPTAAIQMQDSNRQLEGVEVRLGSAVVASPEEAGDSKKR